MSCFFFFFNDTATTEIYTLSLHDALPISNTQRMERSSSMTQTGLIMVFQRSGSTMRKLVLPGWLSRSEEHTSELQSQSNLVCRLLLEKKKQTTARAKNELQQEQNRHHYHL